MRTLKKIFAFAANGFRDAKGYIKETRLNLISANKTMPFMKKVKNVFKVVAGTLCAAPAAQSILSSSDNMSMEFVIACGAFCTAAVFSMEGLDSMISTGKKNRDGTKSCDGDKDNCDTCGKDRFIQDDDIDSLMFT